MRMNRHWYWLGLVAIVSLEGCDSRPETLVVQGAVTYQGQDVAWGKIDFIPVDNTPGASASSAITDGRYRTADGFGLRPDGVYEVRIKAYEETTFNRPAPVEPGRNSKAFVPNYIPDEYNSRSMLRIRAADLPDASAVDFHLPMQP